jgi:hypothetical protein
MEIDNKHTYKLKIADQSAITDMVMIFNFEVISNRFNVGRIFV